MYNSIYISKIYAVSIIIGMALFFSCVNDIDEINELKDSGNLPTETVENVEILRTDSAEIILKIYAPILERYSLAEEPYTLFSKGVTVIGYNYGDYPDTAYSITAKYAINYEKEELWEVRNDVVAINFEGEILNTELLFWDKKKAIIYSDKFSKITTKDGIFYGENGFEADENFTKWKLININNSVVNVKDE